MVEYTNELSLVFCSLADPTRRDMVQRIGRKTLSITEVAEGYTQHMSLAAVSKHLQVLEAAGIIEKRREGRHQFVTLSPSALTTATKYMEQLGKVWEDRLDRLEEHLAKNK